MPQISTENHDAEPAMSPIFRWQATKYQCTVDGMTSPDPALALVAELLRATADAHSPLALVRAIAAALAARIEIDRVELHPPAPRAFAQRRNDTWHCSEDDGARA